MTAKHFKKHENCQMEIRWKEFKNYQYAVPGLYCSQHGTWIQWLTYDDAMDLIESGVKAQPEPKHHMISLDELGI